jgi:hypothetical protein
MKKAHSMLTDTSSDGFLDTNIRGRRGSPLF